MQFINHSSRNMDFTELPWSIQEKIIKAVEEEHDVEFDDYNDQHLEWAQEMVADGWFEAGDVDYDD